MINTSVMDYHADDYALSMNNSIRMMQLIEAGRLDSISILPNMSSYDKCMDYLKQRWDSLRYKPLISVHLNIIDGYSMSGITDPMFTHRAANEGDYRYIFNTSWPKLLLCSYIPFIRARIRTELKNEFVLQIRRVYKDLPKGTNSESVDDIGLRLDSHLHTHMIPVVFDAMIDAVGELNLADKLSYVRVSREPIGPFKKIRGTYPKANLIKNILLNILSARAERILDKSTISHGLLWGLIMSGRMDKDRMELLLPYMMKYSSDKNKILEILCHPGIVLINEQFEEIGPDDKEAVYSPNRDIEYDAAMNVNRDTA